MVYTSSILNHADINLHKTADFIRVPVELFSSTFEFIYFPTEVHINNIFIEDYCKIITKSKVVYGISLVA